MRPESAKNRHVVKSRDERTKRTQTKDEKRIRREGGWEKTNRLEPENAEKSKRAGAHEGRDSILSCGQDVREDFQNIPEKRRDVLQLRQQTPSPLSLDIVNI